MAVAFGGAYLNTAAKLFGAVYPVGSLYLTTVSTNPATVFGFGTWAAFGPGRCLVGFDAGQTEFDTVEETGGAKTVTLDATMIPAHSHTQDAHTHTQNSHNHIQDVHVHTQNSHTHVQDVHTHIQNSHTHPSIQVQGGTTAAITGTHIMTSTATGGSSRAAITPELANAATATNQNATATNQAATATNQNATATNQAATATNQTAIATNQNTGGGLAHANLPPYIVVYMWKRTA